MRKGIHFSWNKEFKLDPDKHYFVYYRGCFCPPTRGHFSVVQKWVQFPNTTVYIAQLGEPDRHGVSKIFFPFVRVCQTVWSNKGVLQTQSPFVENLLEKGRINKGAKGACPIETFIQGERYLAVSGK